MRPLCPAGEVSGTCDVGCALAAEVEFGDESPTSATKVDSGLRREAPGVVAPTTEIESGGKPSGSSLARRRGAPMVNVESTIRCQIRRGDHGVGGRGRVRRGGHGRRCGRTISGVHSREKPSAATGRCGQGRAPVLQIWLGRPRRHERVRLAGETGWEEEELNNFSLIYLFILFGGPIGDLHRQNLLDGLGGWNPT